MANLAQQGDARALELIAKRLGQDDDDVMQSAETQEVNAHALETSHIATDSNNLPLEGCETNETEQGNAHVLENSHNIATDSLDAVVDELHAAWSSSSILQEKCENE